ncbi:hypothetical protein DRO61_09635 [Candidatus Bathyarchaeota archaeon]|nr:MAG: hypothetical protein DRO61_09635 [Candidatus Bathyarchaeota archaeon]
MAEKKVKELSEGAKRVLAILTESDKPLTLAEIKETFSTANSSHLTALRNRLMVSAEPTEKLVTTVAKRTVNVYSAVEVKEVE